MNKHRTLEGIFNSYPGFESFADWEVFALAQLNDYINQQLGETEKAFGGCKLCYGKGYATVNEKWVAHDTDQDIGSPGGYFTGGKDFAIKYCTCDRGKQLETLRKSL